MGLEHTGYIDLPSNIGDGGIDHAAVHQASGNLYVAHTANDCVDVIDTQTDRYLYSIPNLTGVAGALVSDERDLIFSSNRGENTVGIFTPDNDTEVVNVAVGVRPNGLAYAAEHNLLLAANVGDPKIPGSYTLSMVDVEQKKRLADVPVPGRTRWTIFDKQTETFFVNIADPAVIVAIDAKVPDHISRTFEIPAMGPHGLDLDPENHRLFCACDGKALVCLEIDSRKVTREAELGGVPDVIFFNPMFNHLYVAIGDPGMVEVFDTKTMTRIQVVETERGSHTIAFASHLNRVYAFLPHTHRAAIYQDSND
jgi:DNA-binding beta-propeller fold protein YncE